MNDTSSISRPAGYHDFGGLASLRADAAKDQAGALRETARQFEAHFIQHMMKTMRESVERSDLVDSGNADTFQDMMDKEIAGRMAERGSLGLADMIERSMAQRLQPTAAQALGEREKAWPPRGQALPLPVAGAGLPLPPAREVGALPLKARAIFQGAAAVKGAGDE